MPAHCQLSAEKSDEWTARRFEARPLSSALPSPARARYPPAAPSCHRQRAPTPRARAMDFMGMWWLMAGMTDARAAAIFATLPEEALRCIWLALPPEDRARCACVCRAWRDALADPALWTCLRPSMHSSTLFWLGAGANLITKLRAAAAKAAGRLEVMDFSGVLMWEPLEPWLLELATANAGTLRELGVANFGGVHGPDEILTGLRTAAPHVEILHLRHGSELGDVAAAMRMLRNEGAYHPLRLGSLNLRLPPAQADVDVQALASSIAAHASLRKLQVTGLTVPHLDALDALVDAVLTRKICDFALAECTVPSESASSLARLVEGGVVEKLELSAISTLEAAAPFFDSAAVAVLAPALLSSTRLKELTLSGNRIWADSTAAAALFAALASHPSLETLTISNDQPQTAAAAVEVAAAALLAASSLSELYLKDNELDDLCLGPLFDALPTNTRLRAADQHPPPAA